MVIAPRGATEKDRRFGEFELEELVGQGRIGVIYRARDVRLGREVALRIIGPEIAGDPLIRARLNRASTALASVDHPNVVPIYEAGESEGRLFIASRWVQGTDLGTLVREHGPLEPRRAVRIVNQVASALQAAHDLAIMHRSVRPSSVLVTDTDHAYLTDFGLARRASDLTGLTMQEQLLESFDYLAPEYIEGDDVDARVDIYGLGCVLYEALTAEVPYPSATPASKMYAHRSAGPPSARARRGEVPEDLDAVVMHAMAKAPADRPQSAGEFAAEAAGALRMSAPAWARGAGGGAAHENGEAVASDPERPAHTAEGERSGHAPDRERPAHSPDREGPAHATDRERPAHSADRERPPHSPDREGPAHATDREGPADSADREGPAHAPNRERTAHSADREGPARAPDREGPAHSPDAERPANPPDQSPPAPNETGRGGSDAVKEDGYYEPVYVTARGPAWPRILVGLAVLLFVVVPIALVIAVAANA